ncbi:MAG TPA: hypothetical protein VGM84_21295 [Steroidobacteraceae bacterium]
MDPKLITPFVVGALVLWGIYRRLRRSFGRQPILVGRTWMRVALLILVAGLIVYGMAHDALAIEALSGGVVCGLALGWLGIRHTQFEATPQGRFYTPHTYIGVLVTALFLGRLLYRYVAVYSAAPAPSAATQNLFAAYQNSPLTVATFGLLISYYLSYSLGILQRARTLVQQSTPETQTAGDTPGH